MTICSNKPVGPIGWDVQAEEKAKQTISSFRQFIDEHRDEIYAIQIYYSKPRHARIRFEDIKQLADAIAVPPLGLSTDKLWQAYETLDRSRVRGTNMQHLLTDLVSLVRYAIERDKDSTVVLEPYTETVRRRFANWLEDQQRRRGQPFTAEQQQWLELICNHIAASLSIEPDDFEYEPFTQKGGLGRAYQLFGNELPTILQELNEGLTA